MIAQLPYMAILFAVTVALSFLLTGGVRRLSLRRGLVDRPGDPRRVHRVAVPRLGGIAMYGAFAVGVLLTFLFVDRGPGVKTGNELFESGRVILMLVGAGVITAVMAVDDIRGLRPLTRLIWQVAASLVLIVPSLVAPGSANPGDPAGTVHYDQGAGVLATSFQNPFGGPIEMPLVIAVLFTIIWIVGMTNTINWLDGLDGLAAGVSLLACAVLFVITGPVLGQVTLAYIPLILGAAIIGFLPFNIHPARIFMGDSGAMFLGFTLAVISLIGGAKLAAALLVLGVPIFDGIYLVVYRLYRGRSPLYADRGHLHHRLLDMGLTQPQVVSVFLVLSGVFGLIGLLPSDLVPGGVFRVVKLIALIAMVLVLVGMFIYLARRQFDRAAK